MIEYVAQPNDYGCAIACIAMIAGRSYDEMEAWLLAQGMTRERMERGLFDPIKMEALERHGFVCAQRFICDPFTNQQNRQKWPPDPFAPVHICCAEVPGGFHAFVMLADGRVLDPAERTRDRVNHPDYIKLTQVLGIWRRPQ